MLFWQRLFAKYFAIVLSLPLAIEKENHEGFERLTVSKQDEA